MYNMVYFCSHISFRKFITKKHSLFRQMNIIVLFPLESIWEGYFRLLRFLTLPHHIPPRWPGGKASASRAEGPGSNPGHLLWDFYGVESLPVTKTLARQWLPCQAPGVIGSALALVGPVSVYCDWLRWKV